MPSLDYVFDLFEYFNKKTRNDFIILHIQHGKNNNKVNIFVRIQKQKNIKNIDYIMSVIHSKINLNQHMDVSNSFYEKICKIFQEDKDSSYLVCSFDKGEINNFFVSVYKQNMLPLMHMTLRNIPHGFEDVNGDTEGWTDK